jgi:hypothetical protein
MTMTIQIIRAILLIKTCALSVENSEEMANYGTDAYCAQCGHSRSAVAILVIFVQRKRDITVSCAMHSSARCMKLNVCSSQSLVSKNIYICFLYFC